MSEVWIRPLGNAWKVRMKSSDDAVRLRTSLVERGWRCTNPTPSFDDASMVLFRVVGQDQRHAVDLHDALDGLDWLQVMEDPA